ncbi:MAG: SurA N-terminal domain-containing protein [Amphritea sp.]|nr:SurA N-terminal domain-containing protein [Amphritea sp.]
MLQNIRDNSQGIVAKIIVGLIAVTFALFGVESLVSLTGGSNAPATVNGVEISERELMQGADLQRRQLLNQMGENADPTLLDDNLIMQATLDNLIQQEVLLQSAENQGMTISDQQLDQMIINTSDFQVDGRFDREQYQAVLRNAGLTPMMYKDLLRKENLQQQERNGYMLSAFALDGEADLVIQLDRETRDVAYLQIGLDDYRKTVQITDADVAAYYDEHMAEFMSDEQVVIEYLLLNKLDLLDQVEIDEAELRTQFDQRLATFQSEEQREVSHIMVEVSDEVSDEQALAEVQALAEQLNNGADFAELAKAESDDPGSADLGGALGVYQQGMLDGPFEEAVYGLALNDVSEPVRTAFGYHLIKLTALESSEPPVFEEIRDQLVAEQTENKVEQLYVEKLGQLADLTFSSGDLQEPSEELGMEILTAPAFGRQGGVDELTSNPRVLRSAFNEELIRDGINSDPIELDAGRTLVLRVKEHIRPRQLTQDEVAEQITAVLTTERAAETLKRELDQQVADLKGGAERAAVNGVEWVNAGTIGRADRQNPAEVVVEAFRMPKPEGTSSYDLITLNDGSQAIVAVSAVVTPDTAELQPEERNAMRSLLGQRSGQFDYQALIEARKDAAEVEKL